METPQTNGFGARQLGRTGLTVGPIGVSASYGVPAAAVEKAVEHGMNYLYWGSLRRGAFGEAIRHLAPRRDRFVLVLQSYSPFARGVTWAVERGLRWLGLDHADILLLGMWNRPIPPRIREECRRLKDRGLVHHLACSTHRRKRAADMAADADFELLHVRYSAVHTGVERDVFPYLPAERPPGIVAFTATNWRRLMNPAYVPAGERIPTAGHCYRFVLSNPSVDVCMTGPASAAHVDHALEAVGRGPLDADEMAWMRRVGEAIYRQKKKR